MLEPPEPTPAFNLPVEGWGADPETVLAKIHKRQGPPKQDNAKPEASKQVDPRAKKLLSEGPLADWSCTDMQEFPMNDVKYLKGKVSLDLSHNPLNELPIGMGSLSSLVHCSLHDCNFDNDGLPLSFFGGLQQLQVLDISYNFFTEITEQYSSLKSLKRLLASHNRITRIDLSIVKCPLEHLEVQHNKVGEVGGSQTTRNT